MEPDRADSGLRMAWSRQKALHLAQWHQLASELRRNLERLRAVPTLPQLEEEPE